MSTLEDLYPLSALRITCGPLELRPLREQDLPELLDLVLGGIHDEDFMPFAFPWTRAPREELPRNYGQWGLRTRLISPEKWDLNCVVRRDGEVVGLQAFSTKDYRQTRTGETGSWLGKRFHGQGIGTLMRQALCAFVFDHLGATQVTSAAFVGNESSLAVSRKVGYVPNGVFRHPDGDGWRTSQELLLTPEAFVRPPYPVGVEGLEKALVPLGLATTPD